MIFYGDRWRVLWTRRLLEEVAATHSAVGRMPPGLERRSGLVRLLIEAGELAQGLADAGFHERGHDDHGPVEARSARLTLEAARALQDELEGRHRSLAEVGSALDALAREPLPERIRVNVAPEGYAFYALYPETYLGAAAGLRAYHDGPLVVIGLRSIGTSLAAVVATAAGATTPPITLRPVGHPFRRELRLSPALEERLLTSSREAHYAIVDEGPGLSGSSFGAVADWLERAGVPVERLHFFPSHANPLGPNASEHHRARWERARRHVRELDPSFIAPGGGTPLEDVAAGRWRARVYASERAWPPADLINERRKYLYQADGATWLARFVGLGHHGEEKLARARVLERAGLHPRVLGLRHGFLVYEWLPEARPLQRSGEVERAALLRSVGDYLALIARELPARGGGTGAPPTRLLEMARFNAGVLLGDDVASALDRWRERLPLLTNAAHPFATDNRMHPWEWLLPGDGRLIKVDSLDHNAGPDLVGEQDLAWDLAGAAVELSLLPAEQEELLRRLDGHTRPHMESLRFYTECYLAFQMGAHAMAAQAVQGFAPEEHARLTAACDWYARLLRERLTR